jgi:SAM-dependent methyltransferase
MMGLICRICDSQNLEEVLDLGYQPWCNHFLTREEVGKEPFYPLRLFYCHDCKTSQLDYTVKKEVMFSNHTYLSGVTKSLSQHFQTVAREVDQLLGNSEKTRTILDIGSNDGTQLQHYQSLQWEVLGVESSKPAAEIANARGIPTLNEFFNLECIERIGKQFDVFNASGVFFHLEELHSVTRAVKKGLKKDGVFVVQFLYIKSILENVAFDQIYHEHLLYYSLETIGRLLSRHGLAVFDAYLSPIHGGSIIAFVGHEGERARSERLEEMQKSEVASGCNEIRAYQTFADETRESKIRNLDMLRQAKSKGRTVFGMGAPVKGNTLLNYFGIGPELIPCLLEKNTLRRNLFSPGMHIPVLMESEVSEIPDIYYVLAWNFKNEILANNKALVDAGVEFFFPIEPKISA